MSYNMGYTCFRCGSYIVPGSQSHFCSGTPVNPSPPPTASPATGWVCPVCKKGNAPWAATCGHCAPSQPTWGTAPLSVEGSD